MAPQPNIQGFFEAQARLREATGVDALFQIPVAETWPEGTQLNPESGRPFDPTVKPVAGGGKTEVEVRCSQLTQLVSTNIGGATVERAGGAFRDSGIALGLPADRHSDVEAATEVIVGGLTYRITDMRPDAALNQVERYIVFGEPR